MIVIVMGVAGAGKTTIGELLAAELHCAFLDADTVHPASNIEKMSHSIPLTDADREPWLLALHARIVGATSHGESMVLACSALKQRYRDTLARDIAVTWVYLKGSEELIGARLQARPGHFMKPGMLASQFADLEEQSDAIVIDVALPRDVAIREIIAALPSAPRERTSTSAPR
jgi:gluconokinase